MYIYNKKFYEYVEAHSVQEAKIIISHIIKRFQPKSVVDFGCAEGVWLKTIQEMDSHISVLGLDGDYVAKDRLKIPENCFRSADLSKPVRLPQKYDLALSLEVAEHIDEQYSDIFIDNLVNASDCIIFSAAIPQQGGTHHVNEQRQSYWVKKFAERGYLADISIRNHFWNEQKIVYYYRQNLLCFMKKGAILRELDKEELYDVVHPELLARVRAMTDDLASQFYTILSNPENFEKLYYTCKKVVKSHKNIVIYPFGVMGKICKRLLKNWSEVQEIIVADNKLCLVEQDIFSLADVNKLDETFAIIECCNNPIYRSEVLRELKEKVKSKEIYNVF